VAQPVHEIADQMAFPDPRPVVPCSLGADAACEPIERMARAIDARAETTERLLVDYMATGFAGVSARLESMGEAIGELNEGLRREVTASNVLGDRVTHTEGVAVTGRALAESALSETARLGARRGRRRGRWESTAVGLLVAVLYALARHYGLPIP
jgi:hypothetical protein